MTAATETADGVQEVDRDCMIRRLIILIMSIMRGRGNMSRNLGILIVSIFEGGEGDGVQGQDEYYVSRRSGKNCKRDISGMGEIGWR